MNDNAVRAAWCVGALLSVALTSPVQAQRPAVTFASTDRDTILQAIRVEVENAGLKLVKQDKDKAFYTMDAGQMPVRNQMAAVQLEVTFHLEDGKPGTKVVVTEELVASLTSGHQERRSPNPRDRWKTWTDILEAARARVDSSAAGADSTQH